MGARGALARAAGRAANAASRHSDRARWARERGGGGTDARALAALARWVRAHGATMDGTLTTHAMSARYGACGVAMRDADEGEVRRAAMDVASRVGGGRATGADGEARRERARRGETRAIDDDFRSRRRA